MTALGFPPETRQAAPGRTHELVLHLTIQSQPLPKQRARTLRNGHSYTPMRTRQAEDVIRRSAVASIRPEDRLEAVDSTPRAMVLRFYRATDRTADLDNLVKLVKDALNGIAWRDDRQVVQLHASRFDRQDNPRTEIEVYRIATIGVQSTP